MTLLLAGSLLVFFGTIFGQIVGFFGALFLFGVLPLCYRLIAALCRGVWGLLTLR